MRPAQSHMTTRLIVHRNTNDGRAYAGHSGRFALFAICKHIMASHNIQPAQLCHTEYCEIYSLVMTRQIKSNK